MEKIILASSSPRRCELLKNIGLIFDIIPSSVEEHIDDEQSPEEVVKLLSSLKASDIAGKLEKGYIVIGADTIVVYNGQILGKPKDHEDAHTMLKTLSGREHHVLTGFTVIRTCDSKTITSYEKTIMKFRELTDQEIDAYIKTGEPMDKAGAYGAQGLGSLIIEKMDGDYFNVVGLPISQLGQVLKNEFGISILPI